MTIIARLCEPAGLLKRSWSAQVINSNGVCCVRRAGPAVGGRMFSAARARWGRNRAGW